MRIEDFARVIAYESPIHQTLIGCAIWGFNYSNAPPGTSETSVNVIMEIQLTRSRSVLCFLRIRLIYLQAVDDAKSFVFTVL